MSLVRFYAHNVFLSLTFELLFTHFPILLCYNIPTRQEVSGVNGKEPLRVDCIFFPIAFESIRVVLPETGCKMIDFLPKTRTLFYCHVEFTKLCLFPNLIFNQVGEIYTFILNLLN